MKKNGRKEVTFVNFDGVAVDGGFVFKASVFSPSIGGNWTETPLKVSSYSDGVMEIAIDYTESIQRVAELIFGMFSKKSNFANLDSVILNYRNIRLQVGKTTGKKDIISMMMKAMSMPGYRDGDNDVTVDTHTCRTHVPLRNSDKANMRYEIYTNSFLFDEIYKWGKSLWFRNPDTRSSMIITSLKDGIVTVDSVAGGLISDFVAELRKFFVPYSNFYGVKALEVEFNQFSIRVDEQNTDRILYLYKRSCDISSCLYKKELQEYYNSPEYIRNRVKSLKKDSRQKVVIQKVRQFQKKNVDFSIVDAQKQKEWENYKAINSKSDYNKGVIDYTILWAQYMEYLMAKHGKKISDVWDMSSHLADIDGITGFMYGCAVNILSSVWKYGEELRAEHNSKYGYKGDGVVNPAVLTISA